MSADNTRKHLFTRRRIWILIISIVLFMPPLSFIFQFTQDSSFCGSWCPRMFYTWRLGETSGEFLSGMLRSYMGVALVLGAVVSTFFLGRFWCSHICPIGGISELGSRLIPNGLKIRFSNVPASPVRYGYLAAFFLLPALGVGSLCCSYCNFATVPRFLGASFSQADMAFFLRNAGLVNLGLLIGLGFLTNGGRGYCNLLCPVGALDALSNWLGGKFGRRIRVVGKNCDGCGLCRDVCPVWAIDVDGKARIDQLSCFPCGLCMKACPRNAIAYGLQGKPEKEQLQTLPTLFTANNEGKDLAV